MRAIEQRHPRDPHWYLAVLGTDPAHWGEGVGSALVRHVLDDPAQAEEPAYLETETAANVPFYVWHGFRVVGELDVPGGGPHLWLMWRDPPGAPQEPGVGGIWPRRTAPTTAQGTLGRRDSSP